MLYLVLVHNVVVGMTTFTGKEKDTETGYGYFGARYMDHELMTMWLSVDPLADMYQSISPYAYSAWNPIKLVVCIRKPQRYLGLFLGDILKPTNQDVNSNLGTASLNGYHLRVGNVALLRFGPKADAIAFKETFYRIFPNDR